MKQRQSNVKVDISPESKRLISVCASARGASTKGLIDQAVNEWLEKEYGTTNLLLLNQIFQKRGSETLEEKTANLSKLAEQLASFDL